MRNLALIGDRVGTGDPKFQNLVKIAVFPPFFRPTAATCMVYSNQAQIEHGTVNHSRAPNLTMMCQISTRLVKGYEMDTAILQVLRRLGDA